MDVFRVGEVVITICKQFPEFDGIEVVITGSLARRKSAASKGKNAGIVTENYVYLISGIAGITCAEPHQLRRKSPPASTADMREYEALMDRLMNGKEQAA